MTNSYVYFAKECVKNGAIKIGVSTNPHTRVRSLDIGSPNGVVIIAVIPGEIQTEREMHNKFAQYRIKGEWFSPSDELLDFIENLPTFQGKKRKKAKRIPVGVRKEYIPRWKPAYASTHDYSYFSAVYAKMSS